MTLGPSVPAIDSNNNSIYLHIMPAPFHMFVPEITTLATSVCFALLTIQRGFFTTQDAFSITIYIPSLGIATGITSTCIIITIILYNYYYYSSHLRRIVDFHLIVLLLLLFLLWDLSRTDGWCSSLQNHNHKLIIFPLNINNCNLHGILVCLSISTYIGAQDVFSDMCRVKDFLIIWSQNFKVMVLFTLVLITSLGYELSVKEVNAWCQFEPNPPLGY